MPVNLYDSPSSLRPEIGYKPKGFLGGMLFGQRDDDYRQAVEQANLMKALSLEQEQNKMKDYYADAPVREATRLRDVTKANTDVQAYPDIQRGLAAQGRAQAATAEPQMQNQLAQWKASQSKWKQEDIDRQAGNMELVGEALFNTPGHDTLQGQAERASLLKQFKAQYPDLELPDEWTQEGEQKVFQRYKIAKTLKDIKQREELAKEAMKSQTMKEVHAADAEARIRATEVKAEADAAKARAAAEKVQNTEIEKNKLERKAATVGLTPEEEKLLQKLRVDLDVALAARNMALGITTGTLGGQGVNPAQMGRDAGAGVAAARAAVSPQPQADPLKDEAMAAIERGADPAKVRERYKKLTGKDL